MYFRNQLCEKYTNLKKDCLEASCVSKPIQYVVNWPLTCISIKRHLHLKLEQYPLLRHRVRDRLWRLKYKWKVFIGGRAKHVEVAVRYRQCVSLNIAHKLRRRRRSNIHPIQLEVIQNNLIRIKLVRLIDLVVCESDQVRPIS